MSKKVTGTSLYYKNTDRTAIGDLYEDIMQALINIEENEMLEYEERLKWRYEVATARRWYNFWSVAFKGTFEDYEKINRVRKEAILSTTRPYKRMTTLSLIVSDAITHNIDLNLSISDYTFIQKCLTKSKNSTNIYYNASLE